ncbi:MAG TPA: RidA family protein [Devosia sp.]|nr:RidA family protein [Devosia sp.]
MTNSNAQTPTERLAALGITLPTPSAPAAAYVPVVRTGNLLYVSGQLSMSPEGLIKGCLGKNISIEEAQIGARHAALGVLAQIVNNADTPLENIVKIVKLTIFVASTPDFDQQHIVANGGSEILAQILGEKGQHARAAFGVASIPLGAAVEIEAIVEITQ